MAFDSEKLRDLRDRTGLPMMECKKALEEAGGNIDKAVENLRKAGAKAQAKLAGRAAHQGRIGSRVSEDGRIGALVALCCETEPVANNEKFKDFVEQLADVVVREKPADAESLGAAALPSGESVAHGVTQLVNQLRENISLGGFARFEADAVVQYVHFDQKKAAMVALKGNSVSDPKVVETGKDLCMHIVFNRPQSLSRESIDPTLLAKEKEIRLAAIQSDPKNAKKPPQVLDKIVEGQMNKFVQEVALLEQPFVKNDKLSVQKHVAQSGAGVTIEEFAYIATGQ
ncbi:MAG: translation elongation factor Ts [Planctomycetes bacterium]|nr:translation elongation factor Ts [Planctomycetota bacterium]